SPVRRPRTALDGHRQSVRSLHLARPRIAKAPRGDARRHLADPALVVHSQARADGPGILTVVVDAALERAGALERGAVDAGRHAGWNRSEQRVARRQRDLDVGLEPRALDLLRQLTRERDAHVSERNLELAHGDVGRARGEAPREPPTEPNPAELVRSERSAFQ